MRLADNYVLIGEDRQTGENAREEFAASQQIIGISRPAEALVTRSECLVEQNSARCESGENVRK